MSGNTLLVAIVLSVTSLGTPVGEGKKVEDVRISLTVNLTVNSAYFHC